MRILLDESLPRTPTQHFSDVVLETVFDRGCSGLKNCEIPTGAAESFHLFFTADQNLQYQQNLRGYGIAVVVLAAVSNRVVDLHPLIPTALTVAESLEAGEVVVVRPDHQ